DQDIARLEAADHLGEFGSVGLCARDLLAEDLGAAGGPELGVLGSQVLIAGRYPGISECGHDLPSQLSGTFSPNICKNKPPGNRGQEKRAKLVIFARERVKMSHQNPPARAKRSLSAVTSGRKLFVEGDPNSAWSRRYRDLVSHHVADAGGRDMISEAQLSLIRRASALELELEAL